MQIEILKSKIHRATVTQADMNYQGSISIDKNLMDQVGIIHYEKVDVYNITNGNRFTTYAIEGKGESGVIGINGAAAHLAKPGDMVIICSYCSIDEKESKTFKPQIILVDEKNKLKREIKK